MLQAFDSLRGQGDALTAFLYCTLLRISINEIGRWSESVAKDDELMPIDCIQGAFTERAHTLTTIYSPESSVRTVCKILTAQVTAARAMIAGIGAENLPILGGYELLAPPLAENLL